MCSFYLDPCCRLAYTTVHSNTHDLLKQGKEARHRRTPLLFRRQSGYWRESSDEKDTQRLVYRYKKIQLGLSSHVLQHGTAAIIGSKIDVKGLQHRDDVCMLNVLTTLMRYYALFAFKSIQQHPRVSIIV